ncbi:MAG TPA: hypothetical protein VND64_14440 [Pirellulales bacterium]|nr:hypothetical protein [Pirellulales bacterium]
MSSIARNLETDWVRQRPKLAADESHDVADVAKKLGVETELNRLLAATRELFPGEIEVRVVHDLEFPDEVYFEVNVTATATVEELVAHDRMWFERCAELSGPVAHYFCLSFLPD